jgi:hypothetical protein
MRLAAWATAPPLADGNAFPQLAKLTALHCRALNDALAVHLKQEHFCEGFVPKHTFVDLRGFRPSIRRGHGDHSLTHRKASQNQCAPGISQANFLGIGELLAAQIRRLPILPAPAMTVVQKVPGSN